MPKTPAPGLQKLLERTRNPPEPLALQLRKHFPNGYLQIVQGEALLLVWKQTNRTTFTTVYVSVSVTTSASIEAKA